MSEEIKPTGVKTYVLSSLSVQLLLLPVLMTLLFLISGSLLAKIGADAGEDTYPLIQWAVAFIGSLLVGGATGYVFSSYKKTISSKVKYIAAMLPIAYACLFAVLLLLFSNENYNSGLWGLYVFKNPLFFIIDIVLHFTGSPWLMVVVELMAYTGFLLGVVLQSALIRQVSSIKTTFTVKAFVAASCAIAILACSLTSKHVITNGYIALAHGENTMKNELTEHELFDMAPFKENNGLAKLSHPASLQFTELEEMPRLDGATAAYPVYASFVQAVYTGLGDYYDANKEDASKEDYLAFVASEMYPYSIVKNSKTSEAYERLIRGDTDIIFVAEPSRQHFEAIQAKGDEFVLTPVANEAFVFFANVKNPVEQLTVQQIQDIYSGKITNWREVSGPNRSIVPYQRPENSGSQTIMLSKVMQGVPMMEPTTKTMASAMGGILREVADYKNAINAIGYSFLYYSSSMVSTNQIKYIAVNGVLPSAETIRSGQYPFTVPVYAVTLKSNENPNVSKFIDWILSSEGQSLIEQTGYIPAGQGAAAQP